MTKEYHSMVYGLCEVEEQICTSCVHSPIVLSRLFRAQLSYSFQRKHFIIKDPPYALFNGSFTEVTETILIDLVRE